MDQDLTTKTYLVGNIITIADVAVYAALHSTMVSTKYQVPTSPPAIDEVGL